MPVVEYTEAMYASPHLVVELPVHEMEQAESAILAPSVLMEPQ